MVNTRIEEEVHAYLHPVPKVGSLGNEPLDFYISFAENQIETATMEIENTQPRGPYNSDKANAVETMRNYVRSASYQVNIQLGVVDESIALTLASGERAFRSYNRRPANVTEEQLGRRWESYKELLDSLSGSAVIARITEELDKSAQIMGGDSLAVFLLRDGEGLIIRYLESRKMSLDAYYKAVRDTAQLYIETDLVGGIDTLLLGRRLAVAWPKIKAALQAKVKGLNTLIQKQALSWDKPASGIVVQSSDDGGVKVNFASMEEFRAFCRKTAF